MKDRAHTLTARKAFIQKPHSIPAIDVGALGQFPPFGANLQTARNWRPGIDTPTPSKISAGIVCVEPYKPRLVLSRLGVGKVLLVYISRSTFACLV